ncbi:MAG: hypothetical protein ACJAQ3_001006 [Planctomycetota bacterium]|jgi:hypothetical protein
MRNSLSLIALFTASSLFVFTSCGGTDAEHDEHAGHDHAEGAHDDGSAEGEATTNDHASEMEEHGAMDLGSVKVAGATLELDAPGPPAAGTTVTLNAQLTEGTMPETLRLWYGLESGVGSMKAKADIHDDHFHVDVEIPAGAMEKPMLWVEAQGPSGDKEVRSMPYPEAVSDTVK